MISSTEAASYIVKNFGFQNWKEILEQDKLEFLRLLMKHFAHNLYFHNISMSAIPPDQRQVPNVEDILAAGLSGIGGACITQNAFLSMLLKALGFNSYIVSSFVFGADYLPDNHVVCVVEFSPAEKYIFDVGIGLPFEDPVGIHDLPYTQIGAGFRYQYRKSNDSTDNKYERVQLDGALYGGEYADKNTEYIRYEFTMTPQPVEFFKDPLDIIYKNIDNSVQLQHPVMFRYFEEDDEGNLLDQANTDGDRKWILIRGVSVLIATDQKRKVTHYSTYDEMKDVIFKYFPKLPKEDVEKAIQYFNATVPKHGYPKVK